MRLPYPHTPWFLDGHADMPEKRDHPTRIRYKYKRPLARWSVKLWGSILRDKFGYTHRATFAILGRDRRRTHSTHGWVIPLGVEISNVLDGSVRIGNSHLKCFQSPVLGESSLYAVRDAIRYRRATSAYPKTASVDAWPVGGKGNSISLQLSIGPRRTELLVHPCTNFLNGPRKHNGSARWRKQRWTLQHGPHKSRT